MAKIKKFDVIVIGAGSGLLISSLAAEKKFKTAIIEKSHFGGTCLNRGCIPSKILIHTADIIDTIRNSSKFGIKSEIKQINWKEIQKRVWNFINKDARDIEVYNKNNKHITVFKNTAHFVREKEIRVGTKIITADKIFICAGTRPSWPTIQGLTNQTAITSDEALSLEKLPSSMIILGGGYIGVELGHFFSSLGTKVTILDSSPLLLTHEDRDISEAFTEIFSQKARLLLGTQVSYVEKDHGVTHVHYHVGKTKHVVSADILLVAAGRVPNTDLLSVGRAKIEVNKFRYIQTDSYLKTSVSGVWAIGDIAGHFMFKHSANLEALCCAHNAFNPNKMIKVDYKAMPHAIFSSPQIAGVGYTEQELVEKKIQYVVGKYRYYDSGMGRALEDTDGFVKVLADKKGNILGCHIIGTDASTLIHEVVVAMKSGLKVNDIVNTIHIHPSLSEVVHRAFCNVG